MKYRIPVIYKIDEKDSEYINVSFPNYFTLFTFGKGLEDARKKAKEILIFSAKEKYIDLSEEQNIDEMKKSFPNEIIDIIEVDENEL